MLVQKNGIIILIIILLFTVILIGVPSCSDQNTRHLTEPTSTMTSVDVTHSTTNITFELKSDDIRLRFFQYPLFCFEHPDIFKLVDLNLHYQQEGVITMHSAYSEVMFTVQQTGLPYHMIIIRVFQPDFSDSKYLRWLKPTSANFTTEQVMISGIRADFFEIIGTMKEHILDGALIYPEHQRSFRQVIFDYADLVWSITMTWDYFGTEPPEVQGYFEHVINTFKFLE